jgi:hypothetical protein
MPRQTREEPVEIVVVRLRERDCGLVGIEIVCPNANAAGLPDSLDSAAYKLSGYGQVVFPLASRLRSSARSQGAVLNNLS